jgi:hypothetical protein
VRAAERLLTWRAASAAGGGASHFLNVVNTWMMLLTIARRSGVELWVERPGREADQVRHLPARARAHAHVHTRKLPPSRRGELQTA